ncbi:MAG: B3/4 domain-containing protein [Candidatus Bathyarchaeia archaeon]
MRTRFPGLDALLLRVEGVRVESRSPKLERFKEEVMGRIRSRWTLLQLREEPIFRAYRDFFWRIGIDPTKIRPAAEALIRRVLRGRSIPRINTLVDAYNLASMETAVALAAFDVDQIEGDLLMREAGEEERFLGIGMEKPVTLKGGEVVVADGEKLVAIYPYRDAEDSKITLQTRRALLMVCGVPGLDEETLEAAGGVALEYVTRFCGGSD